MDRKKAEQELQQIADAFDNPVDPEDKEYLVRAIAEDRVTFDEVNEVIRYKLVAPIELQSGEEITELTARPLNGGELRKATKGMDDDKVGQLLKLIGIMNELEIGIIGRLSIKDMNRMAGLAGFFV